MDTVKTKFTEGPFFGPVLSGVIALLICIPSSYFSYRVSVASQDRQMKLEQIVKFDTSSAELAEVVGDFVGALNGTGDLKAAKVKLRNYTTSQIIVAEQMKSVFQQDISVRSYVDSLAEFNKISQSVSSPLDVKVWMEAFDKVVGARDKLEQKLKDTISSGSSA